MGAVQGLQEVKHFLIVFSKTDGLILLKAFREDEAREAIRQRFEYERLNQGLQVQNDVEVVVLMAASVATLFRTHGRYFA